MASMIDYLFLVSDLPGRSSSVKDLPVRALGSAVVNQQPAVFHVEVLALPDHSTAIFSQWWIVEACPPVWEPPLAAVTRSSQTKVQRLGQWHVHSTHGDLS